MDKRSDQTNKPSYWLTVAANALDKAVQLTGDETTAELDEMERRLDDLAAGYGGVGR